MGYHWQWYRVPQYLFIEVDGHYHAGTLIEGLYITLQITAAGAMIAFISGLFSALLSISNSIVGKFLSSIYVESIRNTPLLIQIYVIYFMIGPVFEIPPFLSAALALGLFEGAYASEVFRAGILSVDNGQTEAADALGMRTYQVYLYIIFPQAFKNVLPPLTSQTISLVKDSALVSTIAIYDLMLNGNAVISETFLTFEILFTVAVLYLCVTLSLQAVVRLLENKLSIS